MSKDKYNIEEVFKSELEDFEMDVPQNGWSNISNNIANASKVAKTSFWGSSSFTIATIGTSLAIATGAIIYSNSSTNNKEIATAFEQVINVEQLNTIQEENKEVNKIESLTKEKEPIIQEVIDPVIEETKKIKTKPTKQYVIKSTGSTSNFSTLNEESSESENNIPDNLKPIVTKKPIKEITTEEYKESDIEIIEIEATEIVASISASPVGGHAPLTVDFSHQSENIATRWNFKDGNSSNENTLSHTFEKEGQYDVELTITDEKGNTSTSTKTINVLATSKINKVPNIFTPNNDGINDLFIVNYENIAIFNLYIYSKSGELIFESNEFEKGWNGNRFGEKAEAGNYIYMIKAIGNDGKNFEESGVVKLAR